MTKPFCCEIDIDYAIGVWSNGLAEIFALNCGIKASDLMKQPRQDRPAYILAYGEVPVKPLQPFSALQLSEYYDSMANGYSRRAAAARAINVRKIEKTTVLWIMHNR